MKIVVRGAGGRRGAELLREYREKYDAAGFSHPQLDLSNVAMTVAAAISILTGASRAAVESSPDARKGIAVTIGLSNWYLNNRAY